MLRGPAGVMASDQVPSAAVTTRPASVHDFQLGALPYSAICCPASPLPSASTSRPERVTRGALAVALAIGAAPMVRLETVAGVIRGGDGREAAAAVVVDRGHREGVLDAVGQAGDG